MALAPFFDRIYGAVGMHLSVTRESLARTLETVEIGLCCSEELDENDVLIAELTANLVARLYPKLYISGPNAIADRLRGLVLEINPNIEFLGAAPPQTTIAVGVQTSDGSIFPRAAGWMAEITRERVLQEGPFNPYAAGAAAALACASLFRRVFLNVHQEADLSLSLLDYGTTAGQDLPLPEVCVGNVLFVGVGAVGNAALWTISRDTKTTGTLHLVDSESLDLANLQRYVLSRMTDINRLKTDIAKDAFASSNFRTLQHAVSLEDLVLAQDAWPPVTCISVDNVESRRAAQALLPKLVVNGWTGDNSLGVSWHELSRNAACLACLYHPRGGGASAIQQAARAFGLPEQRAIDLWVTKSALTEEELQRAAVTLGTTRAALEEFKDKPLPDLYTTVACGGIALDLSGLGNLEVVPLAHQSALAGVLMAAELIKRSSPELAALSQSTPLVSWDDVLRNPPPLWTKPRAREIGCICGDPIYQAVYEAKWWTEGSTSLS